MACPPALPGRRLGVLGLLIAASGLSGCTIGFETLDLALVERASTAFADRSSRHPLAPNEEVVSSAPPGTGSVILGELIAIFPGFIVKGLGHYYAGDAKTATKLRHIGEMGFLLTAVGGGLVVGGYYLDKADTWSPVGAYTLYGTGFFVGGVGVAYWLTAWIYDIIDTPRAVKSGGKPPPRSKLVESMDVFD